MSVPIEDYNKLKSHYQTLLKVVIDLQETLTKIQEQQSRDNEIIDD